MAVQELYSFASNAAGTSSYNSLGTWTMPVCLQPKGVDATGSDHEIAVPFDKPFAFTAIPIGLQVVDNGNRPLDAAGMHLPLIHNSANAAAITVLTFTVTGKK